MMIGSKGGGDLMFRCPECGSHDFTTDNLVAPEIEWIGNCRGPRCTFKWPRTEDIRYFCLVLPLSPETFAQLDKLSCDMGLGFQQVLEHLISHTVVTKALNDPT